MTITRTRAGLALVALGLLTGLAYAADCVLTDAGCNGTTDKIAIRNVLITCHGGTCSSGCLDCTHGDPCTNGDTLTPAADIDVDLPANCTATPRTLAVCQSWIDCTNGSTVTGCNNCTLYTVATGTTFSLGAGTVPPLTCTRSTHCLSDKITVNDVTGLGCTSANCSSVPQLGACSSSGACGTNCATSEATGVSGCCM